MNMLSSAIKSYKKVNNVSTEEMAQTVDCDVRSIFLLEEEKPYMPSLLILRKLSKALCVPLDLMIMMADSQYKNVIKEAKNVSNGSPIY